MTVPRGPWPVLVVLGLILAATALRIEAAARPGLWADEIFSLAMATGHSLEHPATDADASLGDYVEPREAQPPVVFRRYAEHSAQPAGPGRVIRAVLRSDTSPPVYYLLLNLWTRGFGTGDTALRMFSVWWAVLSLPLVWLLGRDLGGPRVAWSACALFACSPVACFYSAEGRMYSLVWLLVLALAWVTIRLAGGIRPRQAAAWIVLGAAGLLTHYFFAFVWLACVAWLALVGRPAARWRVAGLGVLTLLVVLPWYLQVPASLARWRVTGGWLDGSLAWPQALGRPFALAATLLAGDSYLGGGRHAGQVTAGLLALVALWAARKGLARSLFSPLSLLFWACLAAACTGPLVFDVLRHTTTVEVPRYVLAGLPAALLLVALGMSLLPPGLHAAALAVLVFAWLPALRAIATAPVPRPRQPYRELDAHLTAWARPGDLVVVRSIPSGVIGVARYLGTDIAMASWVGQLGTRPAPTDVERLLHGRRRVAVATIHNFDDSHSPLPWLQAHARLLGVESFPSSRAEVRYFGPATGETFGPDVPLASRWE